MSLFLTIDDGLVLLFCMPTKLNLYEGTGDAAARLGKVSGSNHLQEKIKAAAVN